MAYYNVVSLSYGNNTHKFFGQQDEHNHAMNGSFVQKAIALMVQQYGCANDNVLGSANLRIRQPRPNDGNELRYVPRSRSWEQA